MPLVITRNKRPGASKAEAEERSNETPERPELEGSHRRGPHRYLGIPAREIVAHFTTILRERRDHHLDLPQVIAHVTGHRRGTRNLIAKEVPGAGSLRLLAGIGWELRLVPVARPDSGRDGAGGKASQRPARPALALVRNREERLGS